MSYILIIHTFIAEIVILHNIKCPYPMTDINIPIWDYIINCFSFFPVMKNLALEITKTIIEIFLVRHAPSNFIYSRVNVNSQFMEYKPLCTIIVVIYVIFKG